jgi:hypothetical protein
MDKNRYTDLGTFESKDKAMLFRNEKYRWCSCYTEKEKGKTRLWVKLPK